MSRERSMLLATACLVVSLAAVPALAASKPGSKEHGVNRAKLASKAERVIEKRNGIEVLKISRCGPRKRTGRLDFSRWICEWRAEGIWPGQVPYHCAGDARWKRSKNRWRVDPCRNRLQPAAPLLEVPNPHPAFGFNDNWIFQSNEALDLLDQSGAGIARTSLAWSGVERDRGTYDWWGSDRLYEKLLARGMRPLWVVIDAPCWGQPDPAACERGDDQQRPAPQHYDEFARFAAAAAQRYPEAVGIEVWNEPNYPLFWGAWPEPDRYAKMLSQVADAVHGAAPGMAVVSGGLSPHADSDTNAIGFSNFLDRIYELGAAQKADAIGIHPYPGVGPTLDYIVDVRVYLGKVQRVMRRHHDPDRPLWATEFGVSTTGEHAFAPDHQARALQEVYEILRRVHRIDLAIVHRFVEDPGLAGREGGFGVLGNTLAPKPAYCALVQVRDVAPLPKLC
jgi:polysaccharide biosynthesis protein PslG